MKCNKCSSTKDCARTRTSHTEYNENWQVKYRCFKHMALCTKCGATQDLPPVNIKIDCSYSLDELSVDSYQEGIDHWAELIRKEIDDDIVRRISIPISTELNNDRRFLFDHTGDGTGD